MSKTKRAHYPELYAEIDGIQAIDEDHPNPETLAERAETIRDARREDGENAEIVYSLTVTVNDETAITIEAYSEESMIEQLRKVDNAIKLKLIEQYEDLPENQESEDEE